MTEAEVRSAVEYLTPPKDSESKHLRILLSLAESWLGRKMVEKRGHREECDYFELSDQVCDCGAGDWNSAIDACRLATLEEVAMWKEKYELADEKSKEQYQEKWDILNDLEKKKSVVSEEKLENFIFKWWLEDEGLNGMSKTEQGEAAEFLADVEGRSYRLAHAIAEYCNRGVVPKS
jgi:hypothetical protein